MIEIEITGIRKDNGNHENPYEAVSHYRWIQHSTGKSDISTRQKVVEWLEVGINGSTVSAYVHKVDPRADCFVNVSARSTKFLQSEADNTNANNILKLPEC